MSRIYDDAMDDAVMTYRELLNGEVLKHILRTQPYTYCRACERLYESQTVGVHGFSIDCPGCGEYILRSDFDDEDYTFDQLLHDLLLLVGEPIRNFADITGGFRFLVEGHTGCPECDRLVPKVLEEKLYDRDMNYSCFHCLLAQESA